MPQDQSSNNTWGAKLNGDLQAIDSQVWANAQAVGGLPNNINLQTDASHNAAIHFSNSLAPTGKQLRWVLMDDNSAEAGGNAGSNFSLQAFDDTGTLIGSPIAVNRATGAVTFSGTATFSQPVTFPPSQTFSLGNANLFGSTPTLSFGSAPGLTDYGSISATAGQFFIGKGPGLQITIDGNGVTATTPLNVNGAAGGFEADFFMNLMDNTGHQIHQANISFDKVGSGSLLMIQKVGGASLTLDQSDNFTYTGGNAFKSGGGPWSAISDARIKTVEGAYMSGLAAVLALRPVEYRYKSDPSKLHVGLVAQDVEDVMPEMVTKGDGEIDGEKVTDLRTLDTTALIFALVNAVRELTAEIDALKAGR